MKIKSLGKFSWRSLPVLFVLITLICAITPAAVSALTTITRGYSSGDAISLGSIVSLKNNTSDEVVPTTTENLEGILGVVISDNSTLLSISNGQKNQIQVATSGTVQALISNINGDVSQGDQITASPIKGVGMKATGNAKVVGVAQGTASPGNSSQQTYKDSTGKDRTISLSEVPLLVNVSYFYKQPEKTLIPSPVQNIANALAGKKVESLPIILSAAIFVVTLIVVVSIIFSMIRSSIISVGRNPMSQSAVYRDVIQLSALVIIILGVSLVSIYFILKKL